LPQFNHLHLQTENAHLVFLKFREK